MNKQLQDFARAELKTGLAELPEENRRTFKLMYARDNGKRSVVDAVAMPLNDVVDLMPPEQLDWAMQQVKASLDKMHNAELEREATLLGKVAQQSAALKLAREALFGMQDSYAAVHGWKDSFVIAATTAIAAIDKVLKGE